MSTLSHVILDSAVASRRANGGARRVGIVGLAVLAAIALGADPDANAAPVPGCPQGPAPGPGPGCGGVFLADISAAGLGDSNGDALQQGLDICFLMEHWPQSTGDGEPVVGVEPGAGSRRGGAAHRNRYPRPVPVAPLGPTKRVRPHLRSRND
jgi:hypothetical protein